MAVVVVIAAARTVVVPLLLSQEDEADAGAGGFPAGRCPIGPGSVSRESCGTLRLPAPVARGSFFIGLVNGLMPCCPLQFTQLYSIASGSISTGALSLFSFCLGTIPLVLLTGVARGCCS